MNSTTTLLNAQSFIDLENEFGAHNYEPLDIVLARGQSVWVWDVEGNKYLDMLASYSALNQGHCHPRILTALIKQAKKLTLVSRAFRSDQLGPFYKEICDRHNVLLILDEIQTGLGRTGKLFAEEHEGIESDLTLVGKALSGGFYPISAVLSNKEALSIFQPGDHGSTFGGNPLACAVAREALRVIEEENLIEKSLFMGHYLKESIWNILSPYVKEVRGMGLLIGVELKKSAGGARKFCEALMGKGILCKETHKHVIRFAPPLTITKEELDWALERIESVLH